MALSPEHCAKISAALKGRTVSAETRAKIGASHRGLKHTAEARAKMSAARRRRVISDETRAKLSAAGMGREVSDETRAKISAANTGRERSPEYRAKMSASKKGQRYPPRGPEYRAKLSAAATGRKHSPETCAKLSAAKKGGRFIPRDLVAQIEPALNELGGRRPEPAAPRLPIVRLGRPGEPTFVDGKRMELLTESQRTLVAALLDAGTRGLSTRELKGLKLGGWRESLSKLRGSHPIWGDILVFPGRPYGRYRIMAMSGGKNAPTEVHRS